MPTKTTPYRDFNFRSVEVGLAATLSQADSADIGKILGLRGAPLKRALAKIAEALKTGASNIGMRMDELLPAHHLASLRPTLRSARALFENLRRMPSNVRFHLGDESFFESTLFTLIQRIERECERHERLDSDYKQALKNGDSTRRGGSDGGARKRNVRIAKDAMRQDLLSIFRQRAKIKSAENEHAYLKIFEKIAKRKVSKAALLQWIKDWERG